MLKQIYELASGFIATIIGGAALLFSLPILFMNVNVFFDPAWVAIVICGYPFLYLAYSRLRYNKGITKISSAMLILIAMIAAIIIGELFAAGLVAFIMAIGGILEVKTVARAKKGVKALISLEPDEARLLLRDGEKVVPLAQVQNDDTLKILPGEFIPVDGVISYGSTTIDQTIITGSEGQPVDKKEGDVVYCGTVNCSNIIAIKATNVGSDSSLRKLIRLVNKAVEKKATTQLLVDKWAAWLVPIALLVAVITYFATGELIRAVTVAIVFCPCALALATPTAFVAAIGQATRYGIIIKSGAVLERINKVDTVILNTSSDVSDDTVNNMVETLKKDYVATAFYTQDVKQIESLQNEGRFVCMIGDGISDAEAIKKANVGITVGSMGSDSAIEVADIAIMSDDNTKFPYLKRLSNTTARLVIVNIFISSIISTIAIVLSVLGILNPISGVLVHNVGSVLVVLNAALLYDRKLAKVTKLK